MFPELASTLVLRNPTVRVALTLDKKGQKGEGMPKRSQLGWRMRFFRCLHFALSVAGIWLQPIVIIKARD
jgi:hypothetical protein